MNHFDCDGVSHFGVKIARGRLLKASASLGRIASGARLTPVRFAPSVERDAIDENVAH